MADPTGLPRLLDVDPLAAVLVPVLQPLDLVHRIREVLHLHVLAKVEVRVRLARPGQGLARLARAILRRRGRRADAGGAPIERVLGRVAAGDSRYLPAHALGDED